MTVTVRVVDGDAVLNRATGRPELIQDRPKLRQDVRQMLSQRTNVDGFGAGLDELIGQPSDPFAIRAQISTRVRSGVRAFQSLQDRFHFASRTAEERLLRVANLRVGLASQNGQLSRTTFAFRLDVLSAAGTSTPLGGKLVVANG
jgi:phage baseplate assembly protein W